VRIEWQIVASRHPRVKAKALKAFDRRSSHPSASRRSRRCELRRHYYSVPFANALEDGGYGIRIWSATGSCTDNTADGNAVAGYDISSGWTTSGND